MARTTPSSVLYKDLKSFGIKNKDAARELFDASRRIGGGKTVGTELDSRPKLSSKYVNVEPGAFDETAFRPFSRSTNALASALLSKTNGGVRALEAHYMNEAAQEMCTALRSFGLATEPYENALVRIEHGTYPKPQARFQLAFMLFVICGCLADARRAVALEEEYATDWLGASVRTVTAEPGSLPPRGNDASQVEDMRIGIIRMNADGTFPAHAALKSVPKSTEGATIGSGACDITEVGPHVSRQHARIYFENGRWFIIGMKSTNGTTVISGASGEETVVEPPKRERPRRYAPQPRVINPADIICLADDTRFIVSAVEGE